MAEKAAQDLEPLFAHLQARYLPLLEHYSEDDLRLLFRFVQESIQVLQDGFHFTPPMIATPPTREIKDQKINNPTAMIWRFFALWT